MKAVPIIHADTDIRSCEFDARSHVFVTQDPGLYTIDPGGATIRHMY